MSQAWHEHLNHLSFWEELDRFWNPSKYSCTIHIVPDWVYQAMIISIICLFVVIGLAFYFWRKNGEPEQ